MRINKSQKGFTLVELAIVLVIIGLIVSSVLVGQDLIKAAELRSTVRQQQSFQVAVNTFIGKYGAIPGDIQGNKYGLDGTAAYIDGTAGDGDGDGTIEQTNAATILTLTGEMSTFWSNLTTSNKELIKGVYNGDGCATSNGDTNCHAGEDFPKLPFGSTGWAVYGVSGVNYFATGVVSGDSTVANTTVDFVPLDAFNIDSKIDDGVPSAGNVQAINGHATLINTTAEAGSFLTFDNTSTSAADCTDSNEAPPEYQYTAATNECRLRFKMQTF